MDKQDVEHHKLYKSVLTITESLSKKAKALSEEAEELSKLAKESSKKAEESSKLADALLKLASVSSKLAAMLSKLDANTINSKVPTETGEKIKEQLRCVYAIIKNYAPHIAGDSLDEICDYLDDI